MAYKSALDRDREFRLQQQENRRLLREQETKRAEAVAARSQEERIMRFIERAGSLLIEAAATEGVPEPLTITYKVDEWPDVDPIIVHLSSTG